MRLIEFLAAEGGLAAAYLLALGAVALGIIPVTPKRVTVAINSFRGACVIFAGLAVMWDATTTHSFWFRLPFLLFIGSIALVAAAETARFIYSEAMTGNNGSSELSVSFSNQMPPYQGMLGESPYISLVNIGVAGDITNNFVSKHTFRFQVTNVSSSSTIKEIEAYLTRITYVGSESQTVHLPLPIVPQDQSRNLLPGNNALFQFLEYLDEKWVGLADQFVDRKTSDALRFMARRDFFVPLPEGAAAFGAPALGRYGIQKPMSAKDKIFLDVTIYADNLAPTYARFLVEGPEPASVHLIAQGNVALVDAKP